MSSQILQARQKGKGISFHFNFGKAPLSLRSVAIEDDGLPKLVFDAANCRDLPTLTEEDVATVARLVTEGKRPEFFYTGCTNPFHPFFDYGRLYKHYSPQWLRGTSVGDLLSEADWSMKCLNVGARSNPSKTEFYSWKKKSELEGLATVMDFPREAGSAQVLMSCKSIDTEESDSVLTFIAEPKMQINDTASPMYSKYITEYYYNVAYYDEPKFLKMQELMKLVVALEWMKKKGIMFKKDWFEQHTKKSSQPSQVIVTRPLKKVENEAMQHLTDQLDIQQGETTTYGPFGPVIEKTEMTKRTPTGVELTITRTCPAFLNTCVQQVTTTRISINDYDFLFNGIADCTEPFSFNEDGQATTPDVISWSELYNETVAMPVTLFLNTEQAETNFGGIQTREIPVRAKRVHQPTNIQQETVEVRGSHERQVARPLKNPPEPRPSRKPSTKIPAGTFEEMCNRETPMKISHGHMDGTGGNMHSDTDRNDYKAYKIAGKNETKVNGTTVTQSRMSTTAPGIFERVSKGSVSGRASFDKVMENMQRDVPPQGSRDLPLSPVPSDSGLGSSSSSTLTSEGEGVHQRCADVDQMLGITPNSRQLSPVSSDSGLGSSRSSVTTITDEEHQRMYADIDEVLGTKKDSSNADSDGSDTDMET